MAESGKDQHNDDIDGDFMVTADDAPPNIDYDTGEITHPQLDHKQPATIPQQTAVPEAVRATLDDDARAHQQALAEALAREERTEPAPATRARLDERRVTTRYRGEAAGRRRSQNQPRMGTT